MCKVFVAASSAGSPSERRLARKAFMQGTPAREVVHGEHGILEVKKPVAEEKKSNVTPIRPPAPFVEPVYQHPSFNAPQYRRRAAVRETPAVSRQQAVARHAKNWR